MALPAAAVAGIVQGGLGIVQTIGGLFGQGRRRRQMQRLQSQRKAYKTPEEVYQQLNATQFNAQTGLGGETLSFLLSSADRAFSGSIGASTRLGADPNALSRIFDQRVMQGQQIASLDMNARMANFGQYLNGLGTVAQSKAAEQVSRDNLIKDQMQAVSAAGADATRNVQGGLNAILSGGSAIASSFLYNDNLNKGSVGGSMSAQGRSAVESASGSAAQAIGSQIFGQAGGMTYVPENTDASQWGTRYPVV